MKAILFSLFVALLMVGCGELSEDEQHLVGFILLKKNLPLKMGSNQTMTDISINSNGDWVYTYEINYEALKKIDSELLGEIDDKTYLEIRQKNDYGTSFEIYKNSPDMARLRKKNIRVIYKYFDLNGKHLYTNIVSNE